MGYTMSKNNVNGTINKQESTVVTTPNGNVQIEPTTAQVSRETYDSYTKQLATICNAVRTSSLEIARLFTEMDERKVLDFAIDDKDNGHAVRFQSMSTYAETVLGLNLSDRQLNDYKKVIHKFGTRQEDGTYTLEDKFKVYGFSALEIISRKCEKKEDFDKVLALYQLSSNMSDSKIKLAIKDKDNESKDKDNESKDKDNESKDKVAEKSASEQLKDTKKELEDTKVKLEKMTNANDGGLGHLQDILRIAEENNYKPIIDYYKKWKLDDTIRLHFTVNKR